MRNGELDAFKAVLQSVSAKQTDKQEHIGEACATKQRKGHTISSLCFEKKAGKAIDGTAPLMGAPIKSCTSERERERERSPAAEGPTACWLWLKCHTDMCQKHPAVLDGERLFSSV